MLSTSFFIRTGTPRLATLAATRHTSRAGTPPQPLLPRPNPIQPQAIMNQADALPCLPAGKNPALRVVPMPSDANVHGDVFGGWIMAQVDIAGSIPAVERAQGRVA